MKLGNDPASELFPTALETSVLEAFGRTLGAAGATWLAQCRNLRVVGRSHSGVGFVTRIEVPEDAVALDAESAGRLLPVHASHPALREPAEFLVQLRRGRIIALEAFCFDGSWPDDESGFRLVGLR